MTLSEFEQTIFEVSFRSSVCDLPQIVRLTATSIKIRIELWNGSAIEAFFNEETETTAFALIRDGRRIFGADNTGGWHKHPFKNPDFHMPLTQEMLFAEFVAEIEEYES